MTVERALELYPEAVMLEDTGDLPADAKLRAEARELFPIGRVRQFTLCATSALVWRTLAQECVRIRRLEEMRVR